MQTNLKKYRVDLEKLIDFGQLLMSSVQMELLPEQFEAALKKAVKTEKEIEVVKKGIPSFTEKYQSWYSEAYACIKQLLPDRLSDFVKQYEKPKTRKEITFENYVIEDGLIGLRVTRGAYKEVVVDDKAMIPKFRQQIEILKSAKKRFTSSLFDIKQLVQADLFDSELESAKALLKHGFTRAAGAVSGVILEKHLRQVCENHSIAIPKKNPTIADLNDLLKANNVIEVPVWRQIQHLGDLRNLADHNKDKEPQKEEMIDLIEGVSKITKNLF